MNKGKNKHYVFVYGTLMRGFNNNHLLSSAEYIEKASTEKEYKLVASGIPFLTEQPGNSYVLGELYRVDDNVLGLLDELENHPNWYERKKINVITEVGDKVEAWAYFMPDRHVPGSAQEIVNGSYSDYKYIFTYQN
jgi:gamma-glutamylcyclotransferase (GGCT)/AIG2-like uncharacterized protein YtfP